MHKQSLKELLVDGFGWMEIVSKNPYMMSYLKDGVRMNVYFTTGTVTFQTTYGKINVYKGISELSEIEVLVDNPLDFEQP